MTLARRRLAARQRVIDRGENPIESVFGRGAASYIRWTIAGIAIAVLLLMSASVVLALRQYNDAKTSALNDLEARVVAVSALVTIYFAGEVQTLNSIASSPVMVTQDVPQMHAYFRRVQTSGGSFFSAGLSWIDLHGNVRAKSSDGPLPSLNLSRRDYFERAVSTGKPFVSAGLIGAQTKKPVVPTAIPTRDASGRITGVLAGGMTLSSSGESKQALELGFGGLQIVDSKGQLLLSGLTRIRNRGLLARMARTSSGVVASSAGLDGRGDDAIAFATSKLPGWTIVIDRPRSALFASAWRSLVLELVSLGVAVLLILATLGAVVRRARRAGRLEDARARSWSRLTRALTAASSPADVLEALLASLAEAFEQGLAIVAFEANGVPEARSAHRRPAVNRIAANGEALAEIAKLTRDGPATWLVDDEHALRHIRKPDGHGFRVLHGVTIVDGEDQLIGTISVLSPSARLEESEWKLLESFADQAAQALERISLFEHEHDIAVRLQRSLLPDRLPNAEGVELAGLYHAGGPAVEVGGDWYDAVKRPDGLIQLCVGDVSGRGVDAAAVMGRQRNTFHVYAQDVASPAEIIRRMLRHLDSDEMVTVACISLDLVRAELTYSCAGHPPPLLFDRESGEVTRLDRASAPPFGVAEQSDIIEGRVDLAERMTLVMYTDGLIERRGKNIDVAIDLLASVIAEDGMNTPDRLLTRINDALGASDDDVALLVVTADRAPASFEIEVPADPSSLPAIRRRLRAWLARRQVGDEESADVVLAVSEACNNAIEHGYRSTAGTITLGVSLEGPDLEIVVTDGGSWREGEARADERGRGLMLMNSLMDVAQVETGESGTRVVLGRRLRRGQGSTSEYVRS